MCTFLSVNISYLHDQFPLIVIHWLSNSHGWICQWSSVIFTIIEFYFFFWWENEISTQHRNTCKYLIFQSTQPRISQHQSSQIFHEKKKDFQSQIKIVFHSKFSMLLLLPHSFCKADYTLWVVEPLLYTVYIFFYSYCCLLFSFMKASNVKRNQVKSERERGGSWRIHIPKSLIFFLYFWIFYCCCCLLLFAATSPHLNSNL